MSVVLHNITQLVVRVETAHDLGLLKCLIGMVKCGFLRHGGQEWGPATAAAAAAAASAGHRPEQLPWWRCGVSIRRLWCGVQLH